MERDSVPRSIRLSQIQHFLHKNPRGLTTHELAELCGVCVRTIQRDLHTLEIELKIPLTQSGDRFSILDGYVLPPLSFNLFETMAVFLSTRLSLRQADENNPHVINALSKIANTLPLPAKEQLEAGIHFIKSKKVDPEYVKIFENVALAWITQRQMRIQYQSLQSDQVKDWLVEPYFVDMTGVGYSSYVIGHAKREGKEGIITFKLDRIKKAEITENGFEIPPDTNIEGLLSLSWGVMWGEDAKVKLRFSPNVTRRVKESVWHPSQQIEDLPDGGCILSLRVGSILEITPWIRGWGPDVEVLEPESLREQFIEWTKGLNKIYEPVG